MPKTLPKFDDFRLAMAQALAVPDTEKLVSFAVRFYKGHHTVTITTKMWDFEQRCMVKQVNLFNMVKK